MKMKLRFLDLSKEFIDKLAMLPETGMGYQLVTIKFKDGTSREGIVFNYSKLQLQMYESISINDIETIILYNKRLV